jgi:hypothetical protein
MLRVIGDVHGRVDELYRLHRHATVVVGDVGFKAEWDALDFEPTSFKIVRGNHDYPYADSPFDLGDFGYQTLGGVSFFFVRGAWSIDSAYRTLGRDLFVEEECSSDVLHAAVESFRLLRPQVVITHDAPLSVYPLLVRGRIMSSRTSEALQAMLDAHRPALWLFGHHHQSITIVRTGARCAA